MMDSHINKYIDLKTHHVLLKYVIHHCFAVSNTANRNDIER